jgi:hypothetical protein
MDPALNTAAGGVCIEGHVDRSRGSCHVQNKELRAAPAIIGAVAVTATPGAALPRSTYPSPGHSPRSVDPLLPMNWPSVRPVPRKAVVRLKDAVRREVM